VVGQNLAVHVPSACKDTIEASSGVHLDKSSGEVYRYELTHDDHAVVVHFPTTSGDDSCGDLMRIVIQNSSNPNHTEHFRVLIPAGTSNQAAAVALAVIYNTTSDYVSIVDNSGGGASAARTVIASVMVTLSKYADTTLPLLADMDALLSTALDTVEDEEDAPAQQITLYSGSNKFSLYQFTENTNMLDVMNSDTNYNWVEGISCNVLTDGKDSTIVAMTLSTKTGSTPRVWRSDVDRVVHRIGNVYTLNMVIAEGVRPPVLTYGAPSITSAYGLELKKGAMYLPVLFQFSADAPSSNSLPIQSSCSDCTELLYVQNDRFTWFERLDNEDVQENVIVMRDAVSGRPGVQFLQNVQPVRGDVLMTVMSANGREEQNIADTMTSILSNNKGSCAEIPACMAAYGKVSSRRRRLMGSNAPSNEVFDQAASRHMLAFSSSDITSPIGVAPVCETVVSEFRECRCRIGFANPMADANVQPVHSQW